MKNTDFSAEMCQRSLEMLKMVLSDFSDADMLVRPVPGANHAAWQVGHLINSETRAVNGCKPGAMPELPAGFAEKFSKSTASSDDPAAFPKKAELLGMLEKTRAASIRWIKTLSDEDLNKPNEGPFKDFLPTVHHIVAIVSDHTTMHVGQFQVIRRKLGKPVLF